jgi:hypothetical protein
VPPSEVISIHAPYSVDHYFIINGTVRVIEHHPAFRRGNRVTVGDLGVGDMLKKADSTATTIFSPLRVDAVVYVADSRVAAVP